jgi:hypothetical protein
MSVQLKPSGTMRPLLSATFPMWRQVMYAKILPIVTVHASTSLGCDRLNTSLPYR